MPIDRDDETEREKRLDWLIEESRTRAEAISERADEIGRRVARAKKLVKANVTSLKRSRKRAKA